MKIFFFNLLLLWLPFFCAAQDVDALQKEAEKLEPVSEESAYIKYQEILKLQPNNLTALCKSSELCSSIGRRQAIKEKKIIYFTAARRYAVLALKINPNNSEANFVMGIAIGRMANISGTKEKIAMAADIKKYAELSIKYDPNNYKPYHLLARWHYDVSDLSSFERGFAKIFYGTVPPASLDLAIYNYEKCRLLVPDLKVNYLELAKCYHRKEDDKKAIELLKKAISMPNKIQDDVRVTEDAKLLLKKFS